MDIKVPSGLTEEKVLEIIEVVVRYLAPSFQFGYFDVEDMKQEGRLFCLEALDDFDITKSSKTDPAEALLAFFKTHVRNRYLNLRRKNLSRSEQPCCVCPFCIKPNGCAAFVDKMECDKYAGWIKRNAAKRSLVEPINVDNVHTSEVTTSSDANDLLVSNEVLDLLNKHMPASHRADYRRFLEEAKLSKDRRTKIIEKMKEILAEHYSQEAHTWELE